jgi:hypothetical protein
MLYCRADLITLASLMYRVPGKYMKKLILSLIVTLGAASLVNAASAFYCNPAKIQTQNTNIILLGPEKSDSVQVYFIKNTGQQAVWLDHPSHKSMNAGWSSYLRPGNWSAFLLNRKDFMLNCSVIQPGKVSKLDCMQALSVCKPKEVTFKNPPKGTFWLVEDKSQDELIKMIDKKGMVVNYGAK